MRRERLYQLSVPESTTQLVEPLHRHHHRRHRVLHRRKRFRRLFRVVIAALLLSGVLFITLYILSKAHLSRSLGPDVPNSSVEFK
jgi:hypothetical protein